MFARAAAEAFNRGMAAARLDLSIAQVKSDFH
jgi:hypothetical protein